ncbi:coat protein [ssRNA phage Esthiorhiza.1_1]|uniref:Coat protein n=2 Tax=Leviviricetes TaxID=2842243 RepID=A0A8S5KYQ2_9VIRU|nr:coat protein [ssRNA phage Esthiorhiza.1_1]QDH88425.1 MAG: hypothetical protein H1RhizoLitter1175_000002 [Leviviridae sp.]DAD50173.1 TPA_asm: coat protein [ssRNA phage Esthiorhiza.1_1]
MLADPVTIAASSPFPSLVFAISNYKGSGTERIDTGGNGFTVLTNHTPLKGGGLKHYLQIVMSGTAPNPYSGLTQKIVASASMTIVRPAFGYTDAQMVALAKLLSDYRDDSEVTTARLLQRQA